MKTCGIYTITNTIDGKIYVGYSMDIEGRFRDHLKRLGANNHANNHLQRAYNLVGETSFLFEVLEECPKELLCSQEHYWCNMLNVHRDKYGYNQKLTNPNGRRVRVTQAQKDRISQTLTGRKLPREQIEKAMATTARVRTERGYHMTPEGKERMRESMRGRRLLPQGYIHSKETRAKISSSNKGRIISKESRAKISKTLMGRPGIRKGSKHTVETVLKIKEARARQTLTPERNKKISEKNKGKVRTEQHKENMRLGWEKRRKNIQNNN